MDVQFEHSSSDAVRVMVLVDKRPVGSIEKTWSGAWQFFSEHQAIDPDLELVSKDLEALKRNLVARLANRAQTL